MLLFTLSTIYQPAVLAADNQLAKDGGRAPCNGIASNELCLQGAICTKSRY